MTMQSSSRRTLAAVALLAAVAAIASVMVVSLNGVGTVSLVALDLQQAHVAHEALAWFEKEHPHTAAIIGEAELAKEAAQTTAETVTVKPAAAAAAAALPEGWYNGAIALSSKEWDQRLQGSIIKANALTLEKVAGEAQTLSQQKGSPSVDAKLYAKPGQFVAALERLQLLPMSKDGASGVKCDDHEDCLHADLYNRFLKASEQGGCPAGSKCELHQLWLTCGGKQGVCPVYLYARPSEATLRTMHVQQLRAAKSAPSIVLDEPRYPPVTAKELHMATRRPAVEESSEPSKYNKVAWAKGEFDTGAHSKENTETYDHLKVREMKAGGKLSNGEVHGPSGNWATRLPSDDNKKARIWYPARIKAEQGREEADGQQEAGTLRWKRKFVYAQGYPEQDGFHYLGGYEDSRTDTHKLADSVSGKGLKGVNVYKTPLDDHPKTKRSKSYKDTVRPVDRSLAIVDAGSAGVQEVAKTLHGAKEFVYGPGNTEKGHMPGVQVNDDLMDGVPNPFGEIMKGGVAREQQLTQVDAKTQVDAPAHTEELSGLSSLLTRKKSDGLTAQQQAVLRDNSKQLLSDFFGNSAKAAGKESARAEPAMAAAAERISNERGGLLSAAEDENEGVESPAAKRAAKMRSDAAKVVRERADAREMREKGEQRRAMEAKRKARDLALKLDGSLPVTEEGALLAKSELQLVHKLEGKFEGKMHHKEGAFSRTERLQREEERRMLHSNGHRHVTRHAHMPSASRGRKSSQVAADSAVRREEARLEKRALDSAAKETGMPRATLQSNVRARLSAAHAASTDDELKREEVRLEHQAMDSAAEEIGVSKHALARNVRARLTATSSKVRASRRAAAAAPLNINMLGAHRKVGPRDAGTVAEGDLESMDELIFGKPMTRVSKSKKALLPGVHLWGLSSSPDLKNAAKEAWEDDLKEMHLSHQHTQANLRDGIWSGQEAASMQSARLQQLALPSSVLGSSFWPSGHAADERVRKSSFVSSGGADDWSEGGVLHANSVNSDTKFAKGSWRDDVTAPCDSNDAGLCADARAQPRVEIGGKPKVSIKSAAVQQLSEQEHAQLRSAQMRSAQQRSEMVRDEGMSADQSVSSMMLAAMRRNPEPYEERRLARKAPALLQMMKGVWAGEGNVGAEWHKCGHGDINCPPPEMGGYAAEEPYNHISGEYKPPRWPADPVRAHYRKRLDAPADGRDYYNDDIVTPMRHNRIDEPEHPDPNFKVVDYHPHPGYDAENETLPDGRDYPHLVRWDKEKWKAAADADEERAEAAKWHEGDDDDDADDDEEDEPSPEDVREEEEEEEDETGLRPGTLTMRSGRHAKGVTWEGIARKELNDTFSGRAEEDGSHPWDVSPLDDRDDQDASDFQEYEPQHMHMKSLEGYYKLTPKKYMDFRGVHTWSNTEDRDNHHGPLMKLDRDLADIPNNDYNYDMDRQTEKGHLPGVVLDSWGAVDSDAQSHPAPNNDFIASEPASERIRREHHVIISDQEMNERVGTGGLMGRDQGEGTDDTWVASHHAQRTQYPTTADPGVDLTGEQVWH